MVSILFVEEVDLVVKYLNADKDCPLVLSASAESLHLASLCILLVDVLVVVLLTVLCVNLVEEERKQYQVVIEVLEEVWINL
jgi:hypothetical protein